MVHSQPGGHICVCQVARIHLEVLAPGHDSCRSGVQYPRPYTGRSRDTGPLERLSAALAGKREAPEAGVSGAVNAPVRICRDVMTTGAE